MICRQEVLPALQFRQPIAREPVYVIEALHSDGWRVLGTSPVEYWAYLEAQTRCCSDGRAYRIREQSSQTIVGFVDNSSCKALTPLH